MTNRKLKIWLTGLVVIILGTTLAVFVGDRWKGWYIKAQIRMLRASSFQVQRYAQNRIIQAGKAAVPHLLGTFAATSDEKQKALVGYLIGEVDPQSYKALLLQSQSPEDVCVLAKYLNRSAIDSLMPDDRRAITLHYQQLSSNLTGEGGPSAQTIAAAAEGKQK